MAKKKPERPAKKTAPKRAKPARAPKGKKKAKPAPPKPKPKARPRPAPGGAKVDFICSECYEEFTLGASAMGDALTCPECLHVGKPPQENFLVTVNETRGRERKMLLLAMVVAAVAAVAGLLFVLYLSPHNGGLVGLLGGEQQTAGYVVGGLLGLAFLAGLVLAVQYERNRWEVYF